MAFIRTVQTKSGATAVQIASKVHGQIVRIEHIGSAHTDEGLQLLLGLARERLHARQLSLLDRPSSLKIAVKHTVSDLLLELLLEQYRGLRFDQLADEPFALLCLARIVEPVSKLDSLRVLADLGARRMSEDQLYRCLARVVTKDYRATIAACCFTPKPERHGCGPVEAWSKKPVGHNPQSHGCESVVWWFTANLPTH